MQAHLGAQGFKRNKMNPRLIATDLSQEHSQKPGLIFMEIHKQLNRTTGKITAEVMLPPEDPTYHNRKRTHQ